MGIALSTTFSSPEASPLPLLLVGLLIAVFVSRQLPADTIMALYERLNNFSKID